MLARLTSSLSSGFRSTNITSPFGLTLANRGFATGGKIRDPSRPVRPTTPFFAYLQDYRKSSPSGVKNTEMVKAAAANWKTLGEAEKRPYEETYATKKSRYDVEFSEYKSSGKLDAWRRDPEKPKKPLTGFVRYTQEFRKRPENASMKVTEITKAAAKEFKALPADQKAKYDEAYAKEKVSYDAAMKKYKESGKEQAFKEKTGIAAQERKAAAKVQKAQEQKLKAKKKLADKRLKVMAKQVAAKKKLQAQRLTKQRNDRLKKLKAASKLKEKSLKTKAAKAKDTLKKIAAAQKQLKKLVTQANKVVGAAAAKAKK